MAITSDELQTIVSAVLSSIRTNSWTIDQLTPVTALADTDNLEVHGGKRVVFSILRNLILSKSGVDELKTELKPKLAKLDDVVEIHSVRSDIGVILAQPSGPLTVYHGSTDEGYGVVYDSTRKRFYLVGTSALSNPNTDVSAIQAYGDWSDEAIFGDSPESGSGRVPVRGKIYVCATDGGLYYWNGTDLVDLIKGILANTNALSVLNRRGQVEPFAAVLTSDPDDDPIPAELVGKRVWSTQLQKFIDVTATEEVGGVYPYTVPDDAAAVENKFYISDDNLYLGIKLADTTTSLLPLFATAIAEHTHTHKITLTAGDDGALSWSGVSFDNIRQGDVLQWKAPGTSIQLKAVVVTGLSLETQEDYRPVGALFTHDGDETNELRLLWLYPNGSVREACFLSEDRINEELKRTQKTLEDTTDVVIESETNTTDGLYLTDSAKRAVFNDMFNLEGNISNRTHSARPVTAKYDPENAPDASHPYWCNKIWLTYEEAVDAYNHRLTPSVSPAGAIRQCGPLRTVICSLHTIWGEKLSFSSTFRGLSTLEVARLSTNDIQGVWVSNMQGAFQGCLKLKEIIPAIIDSTDSSLSWNVAFADCAELESFQIKGLRHNLNLKWSPKLSLATMQYLVDNASTEITAENPVVVTVHADVFAKLTGDCDGVTMVLTAPTTRDKSAVPIVIANPGMFAVSDILTAPGITGDDGLPLRLTVTAVDAEGQPSVAPINAAALGGLSGCNIMLADSELAQWAAVLNAAYEKNISFATD